MDAEKVKVGACCWVLEELRSGSGEDGRNSWDIGRVTVVEVADQVVAEVDV